MLKFWAVALVTVQAAAIVTWTPNELVAVAALASACADESGCRCGW